MLIKQLGLVVWLPLLTSLRHAETTGNSCVMLYPMAGQIKTGGASQQRFHLPNNKKHAGLRQRQEPAAWIQDWKLYHTASSMSKLDV